MDSGTKIDAMALVGSVILTVAAIIAFACYCVCPYILHLITTLERLLLGLFSLLAAVRWGSAGWDWSKIRKIHEKQAVLAGLLL